MPRFSPRPESRENCPQIHLTVHRTLHRARRPGSSHRPHRQPTHSIPSMSGTPFPFRVPSPKSSSIRLDRAPSTRRARKRSGTLAENGSTVYDVAIIGSGPAGYTAAIRGGQCGLKVALIEAESSLGGTCLHVGCIPTKALLFNAEIWDHLKHAAEYGIAGIGTPQLDWAAVQKRKNSIVTRHTKGLEFLMKKNKVTVVRGYGRLTGPAGHDGVHTVDVESADGATQQLKAKNVILATGSEARMLFGMQPNDRVLTNIEILSLTEPPKSLIVIGAGAVGVEFASIFRSFGTEVTIVEYLPRVVPVEDEDISKELARLFKK